MQGISNSNMYYSTPNNHKTYLSLQNHFAGRPLELRHHPKNLYANALVSERGSAEKSFGGTGTVLCVATVRRKKSDPNCVEAKVIGMVLSDFY